jgi:uncharacterized protein YdaU (DUF1376 family)
MTRPADSRNGRIWFVKLVINDLVIDTMSLSPDAFGAYMRLFIAAVHGRAPIPDSPRICTEIVRCSKSQWRRIRADLIAARLIEIAEGHILDSRADRTIAEFHRKSAANRENVMRRWSDGGIEDAAR